MDQIPVGVVDGAGRDLKITQAAIGYMVGVYRRGRLTAGQDLIEDALAGLQAVLTAGGGTMMAEFMAFLTDNLVPIATHGKHGAIGKDHPVVQVKDEDGVSQIVKYGE